MKHDQVQCVFFFFFIYSQEKRLKEKHFLTKFLVIIKINVANKAFVFLMRVVWVTMNERSTAGVLRIYVSMLSVH